MDNKDTTSTGKLISNIIDNEKEWRRHIIDMLEGLNKKLTIQNGRVRKLEAWRWFLAGGIVVISFYLAHLTGKF